MSQKFNNPSEVNLSSEANMLLTDLTSEESAAINGGVGFGHVLDLWIEFRCLSQIHTVELRSAEGV